MNQVIQEKTIHNVGVSMMQIVEKQYFLISLLVLSVHIMSGITSQ